MVVESRSKEESELLEKLARGQQRNAERLSSAELAQAHAKVEVDDRLNDLKTSFTDINRINFAHEGALEGVEHALEELKQQAASDTIQDLQKEVGCCFTSLSAVKDQLGGALQDLTQQKTIAAETLHRVYDGEQTERLRLAEWTDRIDELQSAFAHFQDRFDNSNEELFAEQIRALQEALQTNGMHTEGRLQRIEKLVQALRLQSDIEHTLQAVKLGSEGDFVGLEKKQLV